MTMNVGEYGIQFNFNANYTLTGATSLTLDFTRPDNTVFSATGAFVTSPAVDYVTGDGNGTFLSGKYARYTFKAGDLTVAGAYLVRLTYMDDTKLLKSEPASFTVNA